VVGWPLENEAYMFKTNAVVAGIICPLAGTMLIMSLRFTSSVSNSFRIPGLGPSWNWK
jgi:hypothetical protein